MSMFERQQATNSSSSAATTARGSPCFSITGGTGCSSSSDSKEAHCEFFGNDLSSLSSVEPMDVDKTNSVVCSLLDAFEDAAVDLTVQSDSCVSVAVLFNEEVQSSSFLQDRTQPSRLLELDEFSEISEDMSELDDIADTLDQAFILESDDEEGFFAELGGFAELELDGDELLFEDTLSPIAASEASSFADSLNDALMLDLGGDDNDDTFLLDGEDEDETPSVRVTLPMHTVTRDDLLERDDALMCAVCMEEFDVGDTQRVLPCSHCFHKDCVDRWFRRRRDCPMCRCFVGNVATDISIPDISLQV